MGLSWCFHGFSLSKKAVPSEIAGGLEQIAGLLSSEIVPLRASHRLSIIQPLEASFVSNAQGLDLKGRKAVIHLGALTQAHSDRCEGSVLLSLNSPFQQLMNTSSTGIRIWLP